jgi:hypothetical protein
MPSERHARQRNIVIRTIPQKTVRIVRKARQNRQRPSDPKPQADAADDRGEGSDSSEQARAERPPSNSLMEVEIGVPADGADGADDKVQPTLGSASSVVSSSNQQAAGKCAVKRWYRPPDYAALVRMPSLQRNLVDGCGEVLTQQEAADIRLDFSAQAGRGVFRLSRPSSSLETRLLEHLAAGADAFWAPRRSGHS